MEPRISSLIDPSLLTEDHNTRTIFSLGQGVTELPFDAVRQPLLINGAPRPDGTQQAYVQNSDSNKGGSSKQIPGLNKPSASSIPLAEVLNSEYDVAVVKESLSYLLLDQSNRRKRKVDNNERLKLPQLPAPAKKVRRPRIPPLLPGLYEPPPDAGIFPAITTDAPAAPVPPPPPPSIPPAPEALEKSVEPTAKASPPKTVAVVVDEEDTLETEENEGFGFMVLEFPGLTKVSQKAQKKPKSDHKRRRWTEEETAALLKGVAQFGIGNWTTILTFNSEILKHRSAQDLKDRFRICCPEQYRNSTRPRASQGHNSALQFQNEKLSTHSESELSNAQRFSAQQAKKKSHRKGPEELASLGIQEPFMKSKRRQRRAYTKEEDEALLRGFEKHGAHWQSIRDDPELNLSDRKSNDLRDHFRNSHPEKYAEAGFKLHGELLAKHQDQSANNRASEVTTPKPKAVESQPPKANISKPESHKSINSKPEAAKEQKSSHKMPTAKSSRETPHAHVTHLGSSSLAAKNRANQLKPLETILDPFEDDFFDFDSDDLADPPNLNRTILDWADQNVPHAAPSGEAFPGVLVLSQALKSTTELPSFTHIDPSVTLKPPRASASKDVPGQAYLPSLSLSGIVTDSSAKNSTFSLPPAADLLGLEPDNQSGGFWGVELPRLFEQ